MVPSAGEGRMSQRISLNSLITPVASMSPTYASNCGQVSNWNGSPAVGNCWNIRAQFGTNGGHPAQALCDCSRFEPGHPMTGRSASTLLSRLNDTPNADSAQLRHAPMTQVAVRRSPGSGGRRSRPRLRAELPAAGKP
jgi:hypothetical protein